MIALLVFVGALGIIVGLLLALLLIRHENRRVGDIDFTRPRSRHNYASEAEIRQVEREAETE